MMKLVLIAASLVQLALSASIARDESCPHSCTCDLNNETLEATCTSYEFIKKLTPKQPLKIVTLTINKASLVNINSKLKYLKSLQSLDLANNAIRTLPSEFPYLPKLKVLNLSSNYLNSVSFSQLPRTLYVVDLSDNSLKTISNDWTHLKHLTLLRIRGNPFNCDCENLLVYEEILKSGITIPEKPTCFNSTDFSEQLLEKVNCSSNDNLLDSMLGDETGSGLEDFGAQDEIQAPLTDDQDQFINFNSIDKSDNEKEPAEGSGAGFITDIKTFETLNACVFNCSTPPPPGLNDEKDASPAPHLKEGMETIFEDFLGPSHEEEMKPIPPMDEVEKITVKKTDKSLVESFPTNDTVLGEMERASFEDSGSKSAYIILGLIIAFMAFLIIYVYNKRRNQKKINMRKRNKTNENGYGEEMKPLGKSAEAEKPVEPTSCRVPLTEGVPLLNDQNGKVDQNQKSLPLDDAKEVDDEVEIRRPNGNQELLTPHPERVTIKAGELPDSIPKTPLFVHRSLNSDGELITTTVNST